MLVLGFPWASSPSGIFSGMGSLLHRAVPDAHPRSGQGFSYNFRRGLGALFPTVIGFLSATRCRSAAPSASSPPSAYALALRRSRTASGARAGELTAVA